MQDTVEKQIIDIDEVRQLVKRLKEINEMNLQDCEFVENGVPVDVTQTVRSEFKYNGLLNQDFVTMGLYRKGWDDFQNDF